MLASHQFRALALGFGAALVMGVLATPAAAQHYVQLEGTGVVTSVGGTFGHLSTIVAGDAVTFTFGYDLELPDAFPTDDAFGRYETSDVQLGGNHLAVTINGQRRSVRQACLIDVSAPPLADTFFMKTSAPAGDATETHTLLLDGTGGFLASDALLLNMSTGWQSGLIRLSVFTTSELLSEIVITITSVKAHTLFTELADVRSAIADARSGIVTDVAAEIEAARASLSAEHDGLDAAVAGVNTAVGGVSTAVGGVSTAIAALNTRITALETKLAAMDAKLDTIIANQPRAGSGR
jgi:hypothetical protein